MDTDDEDILLGNIPEVVSNSLTYLVDLSLNGLRVKMEVDSGSPITIISENTYNLISKISHTPLKPFKRIVRSASFKVMPVLGMISVDVVWKGKKLNSLPVVVMAGRAPALLGRAWFPMLGIDVIGIYSCNSFSPRTSQILTQFAEVFNTELGTYVSPPLDLNFDPSVKPIRFRPRRVPFGIKDKVDAAIDSLIARKVIEQIADTEWGTPVVPIVKKDGSIRLCGDYKVTINKAIRPHPHPVPVISHLISSIGNATVFGRLDLAQAYLQCTVSEQVALAQTIVTHRGAFKVKRLQFGISCAPGYFKP